MKATDLVLRVPSDGMARRVHHSLDARDFNLSRAEFSELEAMLRQGKHLDVKKVKRLWARRAPLVAAKEILSDIDLFFVVLVTGGIIGTVVSFVLMIPLGFAMGFLIGISLGMLVPFVWFTVDTYNEYAQYKVEWSHAFGPETYPLRDKAARLVASLEDMDAWVHPEKYEPYVRPDVKAIMTKVNSMCSTYDLSDKKDRSYLNEIISLVDDLGDFVEQVRLLSFDASTDDDLIVMRKTLQSTAEDIKTYRGIRVS